MNIIQCEKCQNAMRLQSETLTEEFWVCPNTECNKWFRRSSIIHDSNSATAAAPMFGIGRVILSVFNKGVLKA
jgi:hypothetical protein